MVVDVEARGRGVVDSSPVARGGSMRVRAMSATPDEASMTTEDSQSNQAVASAVSRDIDV